MKPVNKSRKKEFNRKKRGAFIRAIFRRFVKLAKMNGDERAAIVEAFGPDAGQMII